MHALILLLAPLAYLMAAGMAFRQPGMRPAGAIRAARVASFAALGAGLLGGLALATSGPATAFARIDMLSVTLLLLVSLLGVVITAFSARYLDGDARQGLFMGRLSLTLAMVLILVTSGTLWQIAIGWIGMSLALHGLLVFYEDRPAALRAAGQKFVLARVSDAALVLALLLIASHYGTGDIATILASPEPAPIGAALLLACAAILKSAQLPVHGWLTRVMETPTPVSALLHAGIVNAGGFLVIRFADLVAQSALAMTLLAVVGAATAILAGLIALTQTAVKTAIAWSTIAQMGFMLLQCGLGLWHLAVLHIVAHSLYKAYAFLTSGSAVEAVQGTRAPSVAAPRHVALGLGLSAGLVVLTGLLFGFTAASAPQVLALGLILAMGLAVLIAPSLATPRLAARGIASAALLAGLYFGLHAGATALFAGTLPAVPTLNGLGLVGLALLVGAFAGAAAVQMRAPALTSPAWITRRRHLANGLYLDAALTRVLTPCTPKA